MLRHMLCICTSAWLLCMLVSARPDPSKYVLIHTSYGDILVRLYDQTPHHRDNFVHLAETGKYDSLLFHRVIKQFMIQGGDPGSKLATADAHLGEGDLGYTIPAEFNDTLIHKKGALAAARDDNPQKASSAIQFYLVQGKIYTQAGLDSVERSRKIHLSPYQRKIYSSLGGTPHLDHNYTVFGETIEGLNVIDSIAAQKTNEEDRPLNDIRMTMHVLSKRETRRLERRLRREKNENHHV
jgi:cyclophilin family peptidyl-prolyl cis-trans isomerase